MRKSPSRPFLLSALLLLPVFPFLGCAGIQQQLNQMMNLAQCQFRVASVTDVSLAGISLQPGMSYSDINPLNLIQVQSALSSGTLPLQFTLNLEARNPNSSPAGMSRMVWMFFMDGNQLAQGVLEKQVEIPGNGGTGVFPLAVKLDLVQVLSGQALNSMVNLALNIAGQGSQPTRVTLKIKPSIMVGSQTLDYPDYVTINHDFSSQ